MTGSPQFWHSVWMLLAAAGLGALVGFERERADHPAGLRTHILVCVGSALFTMASMRLARPTTDPTRIAAQIVSGIGFLGAGTILHHGNVIRGLTTAASLWCVAGIGMAVAAGGELALLALVATALVVFTLTIVNQIEDAYVSPRGFRGLAVTMHADRDAVGEMLLGLTEQAVELRRVAIGSGDDDTLFQVQVLLRPPRGLTYTALSGWISRQRGVVQFEWEQASARP